MPSLKAATVYSLSVSDAASSPHRMHLWGPPDVQPLANCIARVPKRIQVFAQRRPIFHRLLDCEDELFAIITAALDRQSLLNGSSSFAESLYGLRRNSVRGEASPKASLDKRSQRWTLLFLVNTVRRLCIVWCLNICKLLTCLLTIQVVLPYMQAKLESLYNRHRRQARAPLGLRMLPRPSEIESAADQVPTLGLLNIDGCQCQSHPWYCALILLQDSLKPETAELPLCFLQGSHIQSLWHRIQALTLKFFMRAFPWIHATQEGLRFGYQLLYLLDSSPFYTPTLHLLRQNIVRVSGQEMVC